MPDIDQRLEDAILDLLARRAPTATICPSDAARAVGDEGSWRDLMDPARAAAARLVETGDVEITQGGRVVDWPPRRGRSGSGGGDDQPEAGREVSTRTARSVVKSLSRKPTTLVTRSRSSGSSPREPGTSGVSPRSRSSRPDIISTLNR